MKKLFLLFTLAFIALSCEEIQDFIDPKGHGLVFLEGEMKAYFDDKGDTKNYKFKADLAWSAEVSADWVKVNPTSGPAGENKIQIKVDKNKSNERRTGYVDITLSNDKSYRIELEQLASGESLDDITPSVSIPNNEIWYTNGSTTEPTTPYNTDVFGANILSNAYDAEKECWVIKFDGDVTTIGSSAFWDCYSLTSVTIPDSVTTIGYGAFSGCSSLTSVTIPDSVTTIGNYAFRGCSSLTSITIPDSVTIIGNYAFYGCTGELVVNCNIPSASFYPYGAFYGSQFTSVTIGDSVTTIGRWAFTWCSSLTSVTIGDGVTTIGEYAFFDCSSLTEFNGKFASEDGRCLIIDGTLNSFAPAGLTEYTIPDGVTTIGEVAFSGCSSLTSVTIGDSVTTIGELAFYNCSSLTSVTIPDSVTTIGVGAFGLCESLTSITIPDSVTTIGVEAFRDCSSLREFKGKFASEDGRCLIIDGTLNSFAPAGLTEYTIPNSVTTIGEEAFFYCSSLTSITIPDSVTTIGVKAFAFCDNLTSVTIGDSVTSIGKYAFEDCRSLTSVTIGDSVTSIGEYAFFNCWSLTSVTIPDSVTTIGFSAFSWCSSLTSVTIPDSVTSIGSSAFSGCSSLTSVTIPDSVTTIGYAAFSGCSSLTNVYCKAITPPTAEVYDNYWRAFDENASGRKIYVPTESVEAYKSADGWSSYANAIVGYEF